MPLSETQARTALKLLLTEFNALDADQRSRLTEADVIHHFINRLFRDVLGWPHDSQHYKYELSTEAGRPDITLIPEGKSGVIFVEAKRLGVIKDLAQTPDIEVLTPQQLSLPGFGEKRTREEQQAINYAFENGGTWAILTNFERLRLYNARRDWLVLAFENPKAYEREFDVLWQLAYSNVVKGSLENLSNQRYRVDIDTEYLNLINKWREQLAQDITTHPKDNPWAFIGDGSVQLALLREVVQRFIDRLVVVRFAEDHLVIRLGTLEAYAKLAIDTDYPANVNRALNEFFRNFDAHHNSALFAEGVVDKVQLSNEALVPLLLDLYKARYRSMPADIIGNTYEQYLGKTLVLDNGSVTTRDNLETRKKQGSYYTPQVIVRYIVDNSLGRTLYGTENGKPDGTPIPGETRKTSRDIATLRVLDSACGSGSFLIYAYEVLRDFYEAEIERLKSEVRHKVDSLAEQGVSEMDIYMQTARDQAEIKRLEDYPRLILEVHLYGVDLDPQAAEIAVVNLIMRAMEGRGKEKRLPLILNQNVKVGNSLIGMKPDDTLLDEHRPTLAKIRQLRTTLVKTPHGDEHERIIHDLTSATHQLNEQLTAAMKLPEKFSNLERVRPFHWAIEFPEVFLDDDGQPLENPGFTIVVGNPPWEIVKPEIREFYAQFDAIIEHPRTPRQVVETRIAELIAQDPRKEFDWKSSEQLIEESADYFSRSRDYEQQGRGDRATQKLFVERVYRLLQRDGRLGYVVPSGIYTDLGTKELREMLLNEGKIESLVSLTNGPSGSKAYFEGVHRSYKFVMVVVQRGTSSSTIKAVFSIDPYKTPPPDKLPDILSNSDNFILIERDSISRFSPNSLSLMEFQTQQDYHIATKIYADHPLLGDQVSDTWNVKFKAEFHMTNDREIFNTSRNGLPLYEGKMFHQFDAFFAEATYWIEEVTGSKRLTNRMTLGYKRPRLVFRDIARSTDERSYIAAIAPPNVFVGNTGIVETETQGSTMFLLLAMLNSFCNDYLIRYKIGTHVNIFYAYQLPMPRLTKGNPYFDAIVPRAARLTCTRAEFADLWQEVMGESWDESKGATDPAQRQQLRNEIDALVAHFYSLSHDEFDHILGTFPLVFPNTADGQAKRAALLAAYDQWAELTKGWTRTNA